jgi:hypothetical protein
VRVYIIYKGRTDGIEVGPDGKPLHKPKQHSDPKQFDGRTKKGRGGNGKNRNTNR